MNRYFENIAVTARIKALRSGTMSAERFLSTDQARIITRVYKENPGMPVIRKRAMSLAAALRELPLSIDPEELIAGNRTPGIRSGVVFPEAGISWLSREMDLLPSRAQDPFLVRDEDRKIFADEIEPFWSGTTLEDHIYSTAGEELAAIEKVVKINQKDHAQGHICPDVSEWLMLGPSGLIDLAEKKRSEHPEKIDFYDSLVLTLEAARDFMRRYSSLARDMAASENDPDKCMNLLDLSEVCSDISIRPPVSFREAVQSLWFLFVILHLESNASSFSPGRMDQYLFRYYRSDIGCGRISRAFALELMDALFIKFNQIVYMRNSHSAMYFAGFPIGFNITVGGSDTEGRDLTNELTYLILKAQDHVRLPQPNLTARLHRNSPVEYLDECTRIISLGTGMPQLVSDESITGALIHSGVDPADAADYALVGCVELSTQGNYLGWSDAAMFNLVKVLELTCNNGKCQLTGRQTGPETGYLTDFNDFPAFEKAYEIQIGYFIERMTNLCSIVERIHQQHLPSPFLSSVINNCIDKGVDVTSGGAKYNMSGIQAIQAANIADSMAVLKQLVFETGRVSREEMQEALSLNFKGKESLRQRCINNVPKFGNDIGWVDDIASKWVSVFVQKLSSYTNYRGGKYNMGLYTVSAHVPMGRNVGATPDGRLAGTVLADGGVSPMQGRDKLGPTAVFKSVARLPFRLAGNGALLNMKFLPSFFKTEADRQKFSALLRAFSGLGIHHVQFNVVNRDDLLKAKNDPDSYKGLTVRVAGYTAYFTELARDLQDEIIQRTEFGDGN